MIVFDHTGQPYDADLVAGATYRELDSTCQSLSRELYDARGDERWLREMLADYHIPFDDHPAGRRLALNQFIHDLITERVALKAAVHEGTYGKHGTVALAAERDALKAGVCTGCDSPRLIAVRAVIEGRAACCPDCSTLTIEDRNEIRRAIAAARKEEE